MEGFIPGYYAGVMECPAKGGLDSSFRWNDMKRLE
jgi:hypothetical protein